MGACGSLRGIETPIGYRGRLPPAAERPFHSMAPYEPRTAYGTDPDPCDLRPRVRSASLVGVADHRVHRIRRPVPTPGRTARRVRAGRVPGRIGTSVLHVHSAALVPGTQPLGPIDPWYRPGGGHCAR
jgi:hypothetical protein